MFNYLKIVRELTGDMQLTKAEVASADIIVTTPEKFDVVTRKSGDGSICQVSFSFLQVDRFSFIDSVL